MASQEIIIACQKLFDIQPFVATGILPQLRIEDAKIALFKNLRTIRNVPLAQGKSRQAAELIHSYDTLARYISANFKKNNESPGKNERPVFYRGKIPVHKLRLGSYLYYKGVISRQTLAESLVWQKDQRALFGQMAMQLGLLKTADFAQIMLSVRHGECFGDVARENGLLSDSMIHSIVEIQNMYNCKIGKFFISKGIITEAQLKELEIEMQKHNARAGADNK